MVGHNADAWITIENAGKDDPYHRRRSVVQPAECNPVLELGNFFIDIVGHGWTGWMQPKRGIELDQCPIERLHIGMIGALGSRAYCNEAA